MQKIFYLKHYLVNETTPCCLLRSDTMKSGSCLPISWRNYCLYLRNDFSDWFQGSIFRVRGRFLERRNFSKNKCWSFITIYGSLFKTVSVKFLSSFISQPIEEFGRTDFHLLQVPLNHLLTGIIFWIHTNHPVWALNPLPPFPQIKLVLPLSSLVYEYHLPGKIAIISLSEETHFIQPCALLCRHYESYFCSSWFLKNSLPHCQVFTST
jgi:hypothetical protein